MIVFNLPITGTLQPKVGTFNVFPYYGLFKLCLSKIMRKLLFIIFCLSLYSSSAWAGDCDTTISSSTTSKLTCAANDELTITSSGTIEVGGTAGTTTTAIDGYPFKDNLTINNAGTISGNGNYPVSFRSSDNSTMINSGTIFGQVSVIYLRDANNLLLPMNLQEKFIQLMQIPLNRKKRLMV